jgi:hypothetical protein
VNYEIVRRIGRGGMGVVDLARDPDGNEVALKRLALHGTPEELARARQRIRREAEVLTQLHHPAIVELHDVVDDGDDIVLVMEYLPGGNLATRVNDHGPLSPDEVDAIAGPLLDALAAAHRQGIVHRDVKPANVLFRADGSAALADFGVAVHRDATPGLTATETVVGTPGFMAPEQARGEAATASSDVFSLGATLRFAATGSGPYGTGDPRVLLLRASAGKTEKVPKTLPPDLRTRIEAMLARDPEARPTAAQARGGTDGTGILPLVRAVRRPGRVRTIAAVAIVAVLAVGAALAIAAQGDGNQGALRSTDGDESPATSTTEACTPLPYQPCGEDPAPGTDGERCLPGRDDYDDDATNGCEAEADLLEDETEIDGQLMANLVPTDDVDTYVLEVSDRFQFDCGGAIHVTLTAPAGVSQRVTVLDGDEELGTTISADGEPATVTIGDPNCGSNDGGRLLVRVESATGERTAEDYLLEARGNF